MTYDDMGRETSVVYPNGNVVKNVYDGSFLNAVQDASGTTPYATLSYDPAAVGKLASVAYGNGVTASYTYNSNNFYLNTLSASGSGGTFQNFGYSYDNSGNITSITSLSGDQAFYYDDLDRLILANGTYGSHAYQYDSFGNLTTNAD